MKFQEDGYLVLENFISVEQCEKLIAECERIIESNNFVDEIEKISVFNASGSGDRRKVERRSKTFYISAQLNLLRKNML